jgi:NitT/TauT family transport system ATP-binding protein
VDDLLPIVEAGRLLGFVEVAQGDVELTAAGREFAREKIDPRKALFRQAVLARAPLLQKIDRALRAKTDHALPDEFFGDLLDEHFTSEEADRQLQTAIEWGRYAELFEYDAKSGRLTLHEGSGA